MDQVIKLVGGPLDGKFYSHCMEFPLPEEISDIDPDVGGLIHKYKVQEGQDESGAIIATYVESVKN